MIKFKYIWKFESSFLTKVFTITQIEDGDARGFVYDSEFPDYPVTKVIEQYLFTYDDQEYYANDLVDISGIGVCIVNLNVYEGVVFTSVEDKNITTNLHDALAEQESIKLLGSIHENMDSIK